MLNSLDLLIVAVMALAASGLLALVLMFLIKNKTARRVFLYAVAALSLYIGYVGIRIHYPGFLPQMLMAGVFALTAVAAVILERLSKENKTMFLVARILAAFALIAGMLNAFS